MNSLINTNFSRTYNPNGRPNALSDIKRLLISRDTIAQSKACGYLIEVVSRYSKNSTERVRMVGYLLDNDITVFLCEATSNLDLALLKLTLSCFRLLCCEHRFFTEEHAAYSMTAVLRALSHFSNSSSYGAVKCCLHFLCDLLAGISTHETASPLSHQSAYSADQLLACLINLSQRIVSHGNIILSSALVLHELTSYQPVGLRVRGSTSDALVNVFGQWFALLMGALNHSALMGNVEEAGRMFYAITCQLGMDVIRLSKTMREDNPADGDFIQTILVDEQEMAKLLHSADELMNSAQAVIVQLVIFTKENQSQLPTEEYGMFLKFLLSFLSDMSSSGTTDLCDLLFTNGYLQLLPQVHIVRNDVNIRKVSTLLLGEILKVLSRKYLDVDDDNNMYKERSAQDIHMGLMELQHGIEQPHNLGLQLQRSQTYSLLIYYYFYCQSSESPQEATAPLLPYLIDHLLQMPRNVKLPKYIVKALWLVFAMSTISNGTLQSLDERIYLERATHRLVGIIQHDTSEYYTHNPAILLWAFTSSRITKPVQTSVITKWLTSEESLPSEISSQPVVCELLLTVLSECGEREVLSRAGYTITSCLEGSEGVREHFACHLWSMLPAVLSRRLIDYESRTETNICYILELATTLIPNAVDQTLCLKIAVLLSTIYSKSNTENATEDTYHYEYVCLKLCLYLLGLSFNQGDNRVLTTYIERVGFMTRVLMGTRSVNDAAACAATRLLSYLVHYYHKSNYQSKLLLQVETTPIIKSLREDSSSERGSSLLQLLYMILNSGVQTPLVLSYNPTYSLGHVELRALMLRVQMLCCKDSASQSSAGWKTLSSIFKHAIVTRNDTTLVAKLTTQPWTHTLIHYQLTQNITPELLTFITNWLTLLKITIKNNKLAKKQKSLMQEGLIAKTMALLKKYLVLEEDELKSVKEVILVAVKDITDDNGLRRLQYY